MDLRVTKDGSQIYDSATTEEMQGRRAFTYGEGDPPLTHRKAADKGNAVVARTPPVSSRIPQERSPVEANQGVSSTGPDDVRKPADNSANNASDADRNALTPFDQSNTDSDVGITRSIRQELVDDNALGTNAQNIKVITVEGMVTLRGAVANTAEHTRILTIAKNAAGATRVSDELQVIER